MRIKGQVLNGPNEELIVIPRGQSQIVLRARAVLEYDDFDRLCPEPKAPWVVKPGGQKQQDFNDPKYIAAIAQRVKQQTYFMFIKSLEATDGLEWDTIDLKRPDTWLQFENELKNSGFSQIERNLITRGIMIANNLDDNKVEEARQRFLLSLAVPAVDSLSQTAVPTSTPSGQPAND